MLTVTTVVAKSTTTMSEKGEKPMDQRVQRTLTKRKQIRSNYVMSKKDRDLVLAAATTLGESRSEFLRVAVRERALKVLSADRAAAANQ
jgi:uncharacterized protein (DUF1778 family)